MALAIASAIDGPAREAFIVEMVSDKADLTNAIALNSAIFNGARSIGPTIAGIAVATTGEAGAFFVNGLTFTAVIVGLLMMRMPEKSRSPHQAKITSHLWEAMRYVWSQQAMMVLVSLVAISSFLSMPYTVLLPVFAKNVLNESAQPLLNWVCTGSNALFNCQSPDALTYGLLMAATGVGAVTGALFIASLPANARRGRWLIVSNLIFPTLLLCMAWSRSFALTSALLVAIGFSFVSQNALANTLVQVTVPDELRGRVMSLYSLAVLGMMRAGGMQAGLMGDYFGAPIAVGSGALVCLAYSLFVAWRFPQVREME